MADSSSFDTMTVQLSMLGGAAAQFLDNNGNILSGGKLYTYTAGTTTPQATYTSNTGTTVHTNPIILDSAGRVSGGEIWLTDSVAYKFVIKTSNDILIATYDNIKGNGSGILASLADPIGASLIGFTSDGFYSENITVQDKLRETISVKDFGAIGDGVTDDTVAFELAMQYIDGIGGGIIKMPIGTYVLTDFVIDKESILFEGAANGYGYAETNLGVKIIPGPGATFAVRLKGTSTGVSISAAAYSGFKNVQFYDATNSCDYGVFIDSGATILEEVSIQGFQYGCVIADQANANRFKNCSFILNLQAGFAVTEHQGASYMYPNVSDITSVSNTTFEMIGCNIRQNGFGMVLRSIVGASFTDCTFESNVQAGIYMYRTNVSSLRQLTFRNCWLENNYDGYTSGSTSYSVNENRLFLIGNSSTYIAWTSAYQAGYQMVIDSETHFGGGADTLTFQTCQFNCSGTAQKSILILSGFKIEFFQPWLTGGDTANLVKITTDAEAVHWYDPLAGNAPTALVTSITDNFGANSGSRGAYFRSGTSFDTASLGGLHPQLGVFGGPIQFQIPVIGDPRNADARTLDDYFEGGNSSFGLVWRLGSAIPFAVDTQSNKVTKIGRVVMMSLNAEVTAIGTSSAQDFLYVLGFPFLPVDECVTGQVVIKVNGGGSTVVNNGISPIKYQNSSGYTGFVGVLNNFPIISVGNKYSISMQLVYTTET